MSEDELYHFGVLGMKWGRRKSRSKSSGKSSRLVKRNKDKHKSQQNFTNNQSTIKKKKKVKVKDLSDAELQTKIRRLQMEKQYRDLKKDEVSAGRKLVGDILRTTGRTVGVQVTTYAAGKLINKALKDEVVKTGSKKKKAA